MIRCGGLKQYYVDGVLHNLDGPAVVHSDGTKKWYTRGQPHRDNGPSEEHPNGDMRWHRHGKLIKEMTKKVIGDCVVYSFTHHTFGSWVVCERSK